MIHNQKVSRLHTVAYTMGAIKITKVIDYIGDYYILFGDGKYWYGIVFISLAVGMLSPWPPGT